MRTKTKESVLDGLELARFIAATLEDKKAEDIRVLELGPESLIADYFVIGSANSDRQAKALADAVREQVKETYRRLPVSVEGQSNSGWVLMDYGYVVVHVFLEEERRFYDLEALWSSSRVLLKID